MHWQEAIKQSKKGTAFRKVKQDDFDVTYVRHDDGSCFKLFARDGKVNFDKSRDAEPKEIDGFNDWLPSE